MRCKHCGAEIIRIHTMGGPAICWASPITYWPVQDNEARELLTKNGISVYGNLTGNLQDAVGVGYLPHTCRQMLLIPQGRDSWDRPVYKGLDGNLYVDVDPRKGWRRISVPSIRTTLMESRIPRWRALILSSRRAGMSGKVE